MPTKPLRILILILSVLTLFSCLISIANNDIYQDGAWANAQWLGQDIVTLLLALPVLVISYRRCRQGENAAWSWVFAGVLFYFVYTYSFFMFAAELTVLYLFHLPIFGLSVVSLVISLVYIFSAQKNYAFRSKGWSWSIILYLWLMGLMIAAIWLTDIIQHLSDPAHQSATPDGTAPLIIYSLDLGLVIPLMFAAAVGTYRQKGWSCALTGIMLTKTSTLGFALMAMGLSMYLQDLNPEYFLIVLWCTIGLFGTFLTWKFLSGVQYEPAG